MTLFSAAAVSLAVSLAGSGGGGGGGGQGWSYVVSIKAGVASARNGSTGDVDFEGPADQVINWAIAGLPRRGGTVFLRGGAYRLLSPVVIDRSSVELRGENAAGDLFFESDSYYNGFRNSECAQPRIYLY